MGEQVGKGFRFSHTSLKIFDRCRRRFFLRYLRRLEWPPAPTPADPGDELAGKGELFHRWVEQDGLGLDVEGMVRECGDPLLQAWWRNYRAWPLSRLPSGRFFAEVQLEVPLAGHRLLARFDRVALDADGRVAIVDWKTGRLLPSPDEHARSWQTLVYRYVLVEAGHLLNQGQPISPEQVSLVYWHARYPDRSCSLPYSRQEHQAAGRLLTETALRIGALAGQDQFPQTDNLHECGRCPFSSYCRRRRVGAPGSESPPGSDLPG
jgi:hypothetical protein